MTPVFVDDVNEGGVSSVASDKKNSQENSAKVVPRLTQKGVETSKLYEPKCGVFLDDPAEQECLDHVEIHGNMLTESVITSDALEESENDKFN